MRILRRANQNGVHLPALTILYVEDNPELREILGEMLQGIENEVVSFADAESALAAWHERPFDVVVTDISLPGISGTELARRILTSKPQQWVILCSGYQYDEEFAKLGPNVRSLPKAFDFDEMDALMNEISRSLDGPLQT